MALSDYYLCDICERKTFYDAELNYLPEPDEDSYNENPTTNHRWPDGDVGFMYVICKKCAETHEINIVKKTIRFA